MSKTDFLKEKKIQPKPATIQFLLNFSKSLATVKTTHMTTKLFKN